MARTEGLEIGRLSESFANDVLLALSCREAGCVLVTDNERDFERIRRYVQFMAGWDRVVSLQSLGLVLRNGFVQFPFNVLPNTR